MTTYEFEIEEAIETYNENPDVLSTFSTGGEIDAAMGGIPVVTVKKVGKITYPLSKEQAAKLVSVSSQAPFGKGKETVVDVDVRRARQIDSNLVQINKKWLSNSLPKIVSLCCTDLGIDAAAMKVRADLYKMLLYEEGGHFKKHRDTEKEPGMFGSLLIQLPAEHEGGHLVVEHELQVKRHEFDRESKSKAFYTAFYADCEHTLEPVTKGLRLVLAFNLVHGVSATTPEASLPRAPSSAEHRRECENSLVAATRAWVQDEAGVLKYALPLAHKYTHTNISFAGLKGSDRSTLSLLRDILDPDTHEKLFCVYLALVTKLESGVSNSDEVFELWSGRSRIIGPGGMNPDCDIDTSFQTTKWVGPDGPVDLGKLAVSMYEEVIADAEDPTEDVFGSEPDAEEDEGYLGNYAGAVDYWYHSAVLVFWPVQKDFDVKLSANPMQAVAFLQTMDHASSEYADKLARLLTFLSVNVAKSKYSSEKRDWSPAPVLGLTLSLEQVKSVFALCHALTLSEADLTAIAAEVGKHGWEALGETFTALLRAQTPLAMTYQLGPLKPLLKCSDATSQGIVSLEVWTDLLRVLVAKILEPVPRSANPYWDPKSTVEDEHWEEVGRFVAIHCAPQDQESVAAHAGEVLNLNSQNELIRQFQESDAERDLSLQGGPFCAKLRACAVQNCLDKEQQHADLTGMVRWVLRGRYTELLSTLHPALLRLCEKPVQAAALFALPEVLEELKLDSEASRVLQSLVQARIAALQPHTTMPPFSWCMPADHINCDDSRVGSFLASDQQSTTLKGEFGGVVYARRWAAMFFSYARGVTAEVIGTGNKAGVLLTKNRTVYDAAVKRCSDNAAEIRSLRKLLLQSVRDGEDGGTSSSIVGGESGDVLPAAPVRKKGRVKSGK